MKPVTRYTLATVTLLLASCGQEEGKETPAVPGEQSSAAQAETSTPATDSPAPHSDPEPTVEPAPEASDEPIATPEPAPSPEPEPEEEDEAPVLPTTVLVKADKEQWIRKDEPTAESSTVIAQLKAGVIYRETAARAAESFSYGDEHVLVSAYTEEDYSGKFNYSFWDSRTGDLVGRFKLDDENPNGYKYPIKQADGTYAMVPHLASGKWSQDEQAIIVSPYELKSHRTRLNITEKSDYEKYYVAYSNVDDVGMPMGPDDPEKIAAGMRLAESASSADGLGVQFTWPYTGEGNCLLVWEPRHVQTKGSGSTITCYTAYKKQSTIDLFNLTFTQKAYRGYKANEPWELKETQFGYEVDRCEELPDNAGMRKLLQYIETTGECTNFSLSKADSTFLVFNVYGFGEGDIVGGGVGLIKENNLLFLNKSGTLSKKSDNALDWAGCSLLEVVQDDESSATILVGGNEEGGEFCGVSKISLDFVSNKYTVEKTWSCTKSGLKPLWLGKMNLLLLPESENQYRIVRVQDDNSSEEVGNLYLSHDAGYVIVLPNGLYAGSPGCESILNYGDGTRVVGMHALAPWRNRPAEVLKALNGNADDIAALQATTERWLKKQGFDPANMPQEPALGYLPYAEVELPMLYTNEKQLSFNVRLHATQNDIVKLEVRANGVLIPQDGIEEAPDTVGERHVIVQLPLAVGQNWIEVTPVDSAGIAGTTTRFRTIYKAEAESDLYVVAVGVSDYDDDNLDLQFAAKDAQDIIKTVEAKSTGKVHTLLLTDKEMSGKADLEKVSTFLANAKDDDRVVLYIAGHGNLDSKLEYYFAPAGFDSERIRSTGISMKALTNTLQSTKARHRLLLLDTCHSGSVGESDMDKLAAAGMELPPGVRAVHARGMRVKKTVSKLTETQTKRYMEDIFAGSPEYRGINIVSASAGAEFAMESGEWNNGVFSYAIMKTLNEAESADINNDKVLSVAELQLSTQSQVSDLTGGAQRPAAVALDNGDMVLSNFKPELSEAPPSADVAETLTVSTEMSEDDKLQLYTYISALSKTRYETNIKELYRKRLVAVLPLIVDGAYIDTNVDTVLPKSNGTTALHNACALGAYPLVEVLLRNGANANARTTSGATPEQCVGDDPSGNIRALIQQYK